MEHNFSGSCLCREVKYRASGNLFGFYHCHCSRCRKTTGTGHGSNILLKPDKLVWESGENKISVYKVPDAVQFASWFCSNCGSPVPRFAKAFDLAVVPAGSLDEEPGIEPECHIFSDSKASWSCTSDSLEAFPKYPAKP